MDSPRATKLRKDVLLRAKITLSRRTLLCPTALQIRDKLDLDWIQSTAGGYSDVWKVLHHGEAFALKMIKFAQTNREKIEQQSLRELIVWSQLRHPCILPCLGIFNFDSAHPGFISPWMENGTLLEFVQKEGDGLSESHALSLVIGVAFLHVSNIVHADLKSGNVLVRDDGRAVVADFGLSKVAATTAAWSSQQTSSTPHGTWRYWAHEVLVKGCQNTAESDVYAWGCIAYEVYTRKVIWHGYNEPEIILNMNKQRLLPRPESMGNELWQLVSCCLKHKPERRPTMSKVVERLKELLGNYQDPAAFSDTLLRTFRPKSREPSMNSTWGEIRTFMNRS
ncbi:kinase-like domain-containing protein [Flagelloscypha sp. PMI_526]|nr:kinase-like domain-containing protein [Flagelloscypha sp. PMI_526]